MIKHYYQHIFSTVIEKKLLCNELLMEYICVSKV